MSCRIAWDYWELRLAFGSLISHRCKTVQTVAVMFGCADRRPDGMIFLVDRCGIEHSADQRSVTSKVGRLDFTVNSSGVPIGHTELLPKPVVTKEKTSFPTGKAFRAILYSYFIAKMPTMIKQPHLL